MVLIIYKQSICLVCHVMLCILIYIYLTSSYSSSMSSIYSCLAVWSSNEEHTTTLLMAVNIQEVIDKSENLELRIVIKSHNTWMHQAHVWQVDCILHFVSYLDYILHGLYLTCSYLTWIVFLPGCIKHMYGRLVVSRCNFDGCVLFRCGGAPNQ